MYFLNNLPKQDVEFVTEQYTNSVPSEKIHTSGLEKLKPNTKSSFIKSNKIKKADELKGILSAYGKLTDEDIEASVAEGAIDGAFNE